MQNELVYLNEQYENACPMSKNDRQRSTPGTLCHNSAYTERNCISQKTQLTSYSCETAECKSIEQRIYPESSCSSSAHRQTLPGSCSSMR